VTDHQTLSRCLVGQSVYVRCKVITWVRSSNAAHILHSSFWLVGKGRGKSTRKCESVHYIIFWREFCLPFAVYLFLHDLCFCARSFVRAQILPDQSLHMLAFRCWWCTIRSLCMTCSFYGCSTILTFRQNCWQLLVSDNRAVLWWQLNQTVSFSLGDAYYPFLCTDFII
jgi:hypothetical protein